MTIEIVVAGIVTAVALLMIVRDDRPRTASAWAFSVFAAIYLGVACAFAAWLVRVLIASGWATAAWVILTTSAVLYAWIGVRCAASELRVGGLRGVVYAVVLFCCWPVVLSLAARALSPADDYD